MSVSTAITLGLLCFFGLVAAAVVVTWAWQRHVTPRAPPTGWLGESITPAALGPRSKAPERVAQTTVLTQGVVLACEMARADGEVDETERRSIRNFIMKNVGNADKEYAAAVMREGLEGAGSGEEAVKQAIGTLHGVASHEQRELIMRLLVHVAQADGVIHAGEMAFMESVCSSLGLEANQVWSDDEAEIGPPASAD